jgi:hypothetical protein
MPRLAGDVKTGRFYIRLEESAIEEIGRYVEASGMYQTHFLALSLMTGARQISRQMNPELFLTEQQMQALGTAQVEAMMKHFPFDEEQLERITENAIANYLKHAQAQEEKQEQEQE